MKATPAQAVSVLRNLLSDLFDEKESRLGLLGSDVVTADLIPEDLKFEKSILSAFFTCDEKGDAPTPENIALYAQSKDPQVLEKVRALAAQANPRPMLRANAVWFLGWVHQEMLAEAALEVSRVSNLDYADVGEKRDRMLDALINLPMADTQESYTRVEMMDMFEEEQKKRVERREHGQSLGAVLPFSELRNAIPVLAEGDITLLTAPPKSGKAQPLDAKILTPSGWTTIGELHLDDLVSNSHGGVSKVTGIFPQGKQSVYKITFNDDSSTECTLDHLWLIEGRGLRKGNQVLSLREIMSKTLKVDGEKGNRWRIPVADPVEMNYSNGFSIHPYLLGVLLGDGNLTDNSPSISSADPSLLEEISTLLPKQVTLKYRGQYDWNITGNSSLGGKTSKLNSITDELRTMNLMGCDSFHKFIPHEYLFSPLNIRIALFQGLMDTDGSVTKNSDTGVGHGIEYTTVSKRLAEDVIQLTRSLGGIAHINERHTTFTYKGEKKIGALSYRITISLKGGFDPFRLHRKLKDYTGRTKKPLRRAILSIEYIGEKEAQCIAVDAEDHLYITDDYIVTHNTTMVMEMADYNANENDIDVLVLLLETSPTTIEERFLARELLIPGKSLRDGAVNLNSPQFKARYDAYKGRQREQWATKGRIYLEYVAGSKLSEITTKIRIHKRLADARNRPLLVIVDYLQRIQKASNKTEVEAIAMISNFIKDLAVRYHCHIMLLSQESFSGNNREQGDSRAHGSNTPIFVAQVHIAMRVLNAVEDVVYTNADGEIQLNAVGQKRMWQIAGKQKRQSMVRYDILRANDNDTAQAYVMVENPLFLMYDVPSEDLEKLSYIFKTQVVTFDADLKNPDRRII